MMKWLLLALALLFASPAAAQSPVCPSPGGLAFAQSSGCALIPSGPAYVGPADIVASPTGCWALRACSNALANAGATTTKVVDVRGATTATSCTIFLKGNGTGNLDFTTSGAGGVGNQCASGATTFCTVTNPFCTGSHIYDQVGGLACCTQATVANQPTFTFNCVNTSLPCLTYVSPQTLFGVGSASSIAQPYSIAAVADPTTIGANNGLFTSSAGSYEGILFQTPNFAVYAGGTLNHSVTTSAWHSFQGVFNGASGVNNVDNASPATGNTGAASFEAGASKPWYLGMDSDGQAFIGKLTEAVIWSSALNSTQQTNLCHNQFSYWGTGTSC